MCINAKCNDCDSDCVCGRELVIKVLNRINYDINNGDVNEVIDLLCEIPIERLKEYLNE